jgi:two-component sensor histidine kinase
MELQHEAALAREANHRIANNLSILSGLIQRQLRALSGNEAADLRALLREVMVKIVGMGEFHRRLAEQPRGDRIELGNYLIQISGAIQSMLPARERMNTVFHLDNRCHVSATAAHCFGLILGEVMMNAIKHAHPAGLPVVLTVSCSSGDTDFAIEIADDGVGLPENFDPIKQGGAGFQIIAALAKSADAHLDIESDDLGLSFRFTLPRSL